MRKKPARVRGARCLAITPDLKADVRRRYETTAERLATMAADCGCCGETVRAMAKRDGWVRYEPPPRDLSPAARLRMKAEALAGQQSPLIPAQAGQESPPVQQTPFVPAKAGTQEPDGKALPCDPGFPLARERTGVVPPEQDAGTAPDPAVVAKQMLREVSGFLDDVRAARQRMKREGYAKHDLQAVARVIHDCTASLARLQPMARRVAAPEISQENAYDDMPADLDDFRDALARQIDALLADAPDERDCAPAADADAAAPQA